MFCVVLSRGAEFVFCFLKQPGKAFTTGSLRGCVISVEFEALTGL